VDEGFQFKLKISYVPAFEDLMDAIESDIERVEDSVIDDSWFFPVGISLYPRYQWDMGLYLGGGVGPLMFIFASGFEDDYFHWQVPVSLYLGYMLFDDGPVSVYVQAGPSYHIAGGDFYDGSNVGLTASVGVEFFRSSHFAMGIEGTYDGAEVKIGDEDIGLRDATVKAAEYSVGLFFVFK